MRWLPALALLACVKTPPAPQLDAGAADAARDAAAATSHAPDAAPDKVAMAARGKKLYDRYCNFCHGDEGKGYKADEAPALASDDLLSIASDDYLEQAILKGRPGTTMSAWSIARGGPFGVEQAKELVAYLRTWQTRPSETLAARDASTGDPARGATLYAAKCASCHGAKGVGGKHNSLANPELLAAASDAFLATTIRRGRAGTPMPAFALDDAQIDDLVALLRSWQKPPDGEVELPPKPGGLKDVVLNPKGPFPAFAPDGGPLDFVPADTVKRELDRKAAIVIADARPPSDYARMHVAGAISVPFYDVEKYAAQIPKDRFVVTYCACPHGSSVKARDAFRALGYKNVAVLDEGINAWRDRGYGVRGGPKP